MNRSFGKILFLVIVALLGVGLYLFLNPRKMVITERVPWGLSVGTEIREGKNYQELLSWEGEVFTLKEEFESILRKIERDPENFESLTRFLNEQNDYPLYLLHAMLFALEQKEPSVYRTRFLNRHFPQLAALKDRFQREPFFLYLLGLKELQEGNPGPALHFF